MARVELLYTTATHFTLLDAYMTEITSSPPTMPPKKRTAAAQQSSAVSLTPEKRHKDTPSVVNKAAAKKLQNSHSKFSISTLQTWFKKYAEPGENTIGPAGIFKLCDDIEVTPEDIIMLILAWQLDAKEAGHFSWEEWSTGMRKLNTDNAAKLREKKNDLKNLISDRKDFKEFFRFAFEFSRVNNQKNLDIETAAFLLELLLKGQWPDLPHFLEFLRNSQYKVVNRDQWMNILEFSHSVSPDLSDYDMNGAWSVLLDSYVEWRRQHL